LIPLYFDNSADGREQGTGFQLDQLRCREPLEWRASAKGTGLCAAPARNPAGPLSDPLL